MFFTSVRSGERARKLLPAITTTVVTLLLALHAWLGVSGLIGKGVTADEIAHLTAGYSYWKFDDYRIQPENGNLPQRWGALPLLILDPRLEPWQTPKDWAISAQWRISHDFFFSAGNNTDYMLFCARATMVLWSVGGGLLVFFWARRWWGLRGGFFSLLLFAISPTTLAHGPLVTSDMCAAVLLVAAAGAWWRVTGELTAGNLAASCLATALAFVAKYSCVLLLPTFAVLLGWRLLSSRPVKVVWGWRNHAEAAVNHTRGRKLGLLLAMGALHAVAAWAAIWTFFGWRFSGFDPEMPQGLAYYLPWTLLIPANGVWHHVIPAALQLKILPEAYIEGFAHMLYQGSERGAFLLGNYRTTGWWWFFPYAFFAKSSIAELVATAAMAGVGATRWLRIGVQGDWREAARRLENIAPLLVFGGIFAAFAVASTLNIGQRHILPLYFVVFILAGALPGMLRPAWGRWVAAALALLAAAESWSIRPHYLAFFNQLTGGPQNGWRQLVDSSLDWGQDLPLVADWVRQNRRSCEPVFVAHFGTGNPFYEGIRGRELSIYYGYGRNRVWYELEAGLYCVSATMLQDVYSPAHGFWTLRNELLYRELLPNIRNEIASGQRSRQYDDFGDGDSRFVRIADRLRFARLCNYLRVRKPDAIVGHSYFIFRLDAEEVRIAVDGTLDELAGLIDAATEAAKAAP